MVVARARRSRSSRMTRKWSRASAWVTMSSSRPSYSSMLTWLSGSRRPPKRLLVLRTPLATARTLPWPWVTSVTMRSDSPNRIVRSTTPWSRYKPIQGPVSARGAAKAAIPALELAHGVVQVLAREVGPQRVGEEELAVGQLPEQEVGDPVLPRGADDEVGVGHLGVVEAGPDGTLVDL